MTWAWPPILTLQSSSDRRARFVPFSCTSDHHSFGCSLAMRLRPWNHMKWSGDSLAPTLRESVPIHTVHLLTEAPVVSGALSINNAKLQMRFLGVGWLYGGGGFLFLFLKETCPWRKVRQRSGRLENGSQGWYRMRLGTRVNRKWWHFQLKLLRLHRRAMVLQMNTSKYFAASLLPLILCQSFINCYPDVYR